MEAKYKKLAISLAIQAGTIMKINFTQNMKKEWKKDNSPITETDKVINKLVIETLNANFPNHSIIGEEKSQLVENSEYTWVCDPVDGTFPFSHGYPCFVFSLALTKNGKTILGVIYDPVLDRLYYAQNSEPTTLNGKPVKVSDQSEIKNSMIDCVAWESAKYNLFDFHRHNQKMGGHTSTLLSVCYSATLVASGEFHATIYPDINPWDGAAVKIIVENAGGKVTDIFGNDQRYDSKLQGFIASNGLLHDQIVRVVKSSMDSST